MKQISAIIFFLGLSIILQPSVRTGTLPEKRAQYNKIIKSYGLARSLEEFGEFTRNYHGDDQYSLVSLINPKGQVLFILGEIHEHDEESYSAGINLIRNFKHRLLESVTYKELVAMDYYRDPEGYAESNNENKALILPYGSLISAAQKMFGSINININN